MTCDMLLLQGERYEKVFNLFWPCCWNNFVKLFFNWEVFNKECRSKT